jgi:hypothetical protein
MGTLKPSGKLQLATRLAEVRESILRLPEPPVAEARLDPTDEAPDPSQFEERYRTLFDELKVLLDLTRAWDSRVPGRWKVRYDARSYHLTLDAFRDNALDPWLHKFFQWADRCVERGFALYLDY